MREVSDLAAHRSTSTRADSALAISMSRPWAACWYGGARRRVSEPAHQLGQGGARQRRGQAPVCLRSCQRRSARPASFRAR